MADKTTFTTDEWKQLLESVMMSSMAVTAAEPSGLFGTVKEAAAAGMALSRAKADAAVNPLVRAVVEDLGTAEGRAAASEGLKAKLAGSKPADLKARAIASLGQVSALLDVKAPGDAAAFKAWLRDVAQRVAEASSEGGFLGFGGVKVSEAEKATLAEVAGALKLTA
jgi:hypothetical protein